MRKGFLAISAATLLVVATAALSQAAQGQDGRRGQPMTRAQFESQAYLAIERRLRNELRLPDSTMQRLIVSAARFRDSARVLYERDRFVRNQLENTGDRSRAARRQIASDSLNNAARAVVARTDSRIQCLLNEFLRVQQLRLDIRTAEVRELGGFLLPHQLLVYIGVQEQVQRILDNAYADMNERNRGRGGRAGGRQGPPPAGRAASPPTVGRAGPPQGMRPTGPFAGICPVPPVN